MKIRINEKTHTYFVDGNIASISVTELLHKHGLAPSYDGVDAEVLAQAAIYGKRVHKDIENYMNKTSHDPETYEGSQFAEWTAKNLDCGVAEQMLAYEYNGMIVAGTADIMAIEKDGATIVGDHKTTSTFQREYFAWQLSLLDYMARQMKGGPVNGYPIFWKGADKFLVFWYHDGAFDVKEVGRVPDEEIVRLLDAEYHGEKYRRPALVVEPELKAAIEKAEATLIAIEEQKKVAERNAAELREQLMNAMRMQGITSWETDKIKATYVAEFERDSVDTKQLKAKYPAIYAECKKTSKVKASVRVAIKEEADE